MDEVNEIQAKISVGDAVTRGRMQKCFYTKPDHRYSFVRNEFFPSILKHSVCVVFLLFLLPLVNVKLHLVCKIK